MLCTRRGVREKGAGERSKETRSREKVGGRREEGEGSRDMGEEREGVEVGFAGLIISYALTPNHPSTLQRSTGGVAGIIQLVIVFRVLSPLPISPGSRPPSFCTGDRGVCYFATENCHTDRQQRCGCLPNRECGRRRGSCALATHSALAPGAVSFSC